MTLPGNRTADSPGESSSPRPEDELVFSLCHELGNLMGAMRLHAHLLDDGMGPADLARTAIDLDDLSARSAALLGLVRPLLSPQARSPEIVPVELLVGNLEGLMVAHGGRGTAVNFETEPGAGGVRVDVGMIQRLLQSFLYLALEATAGSGRVKVRAATQGDEAAISIEDDGAEGEDPAAFREQMMRGRPLLSAIADAILAKQGGRFEAERDGDWTRITLILQAVPLPAR